MRRFLTLVVLLWCSCTWASNYTIHTVTNNSAFGPGSLYQASLDCASNTTPDSIVFAGTADTIPILWAMSFASDTVIIVGPSAQSLVINGLDHTRLLEVQSGYVEVHNVTIYNGRHAGLPGSPGSPGSAGIPPMPIPPPGMPGTDGGGGSGGTGGHPGFGGAAYITGGMVLFQHVTFSGNKAIGGNGGMGGTGGFGYLGSPGAFGTGGTGGTNGGAGANGSSGAPGSPGGSGGNGGGGAAQGGAVYVGAGASVAFSYCVLHSNSATGGTSPTGAANTQGGSGQTEGDNVYVHPSGIATAYSSILSGSSSNLAVCGLEADLSAWDNPGAGNTLTLDGVDDEFLIADDTTLDVSTQFTLSFWMKSEQHGSHSYDGLLWKKPGAAYTDATGWFLEADGTNSLLFYGGGSTEASWTVDAFGTDGRWHHVAVVVSTDSARLYWDGIDYGHRAIGAITPNNEPIILGSDPQSADRHFKGKLDELRIWAAPLSEGEIRSWMCQKLLNSHPQICSLRANYRFDEAASDTLGRDLTTNNNHGTFANGASRAVSGAPIGDISTFDYAGTASSLMLAHAYGAATATNFSGDLAGAHIYFAQDTPNDTTTNNFGGEIFLHAVAGCFIAGGSNSQYDVRFDHGPLIQTVTSAGLAPLLRIARRANNAAGAWNTANTFADSDTTHITACGQTKPYEFALFWDTTYAPQQVLACGPYPIGNVVYDTTGLYLDTLTNAGGCDSIEYVALVIPVLELDTAIGATDACTPTGSVAVSVLHSNGTPSYLWSNGQTTAQANNLAPGTYSVTVVTPDSCVLHASVPVSNLTPCPAPTGLRSLFVQDTSAVLEWDTVCGATAYKVQWKLAGASSWNTAFKYGNHGRYTIQGLAPASVYKWRIAAKCDTNFSTHAAQQRMVTLAQPCPIPNNLSAGPNTATHVRLNWALVPNAVSYKIRWRKVGTSTWTVVRKDGNKDKHWLNPGPLGLQYEWQIKTLCSKGKVTGTRWSTVQTFGGIVTKWEPDHEAGRMDGVELTVFPNPAKGAIQLQYQAPTAATITMELVSMVGQVLVSQQLAYTSGTLTTSLDLTGVAPGTYLIRFRTPNGILHRKLILEQ